MQPKLTSGEICISGVLQHLSVRLYLIEEGSRELQWMDLNPQNQHSSLKGLHVALKYRTRRSCLDVTLLSIDACHLRKPLIGQLENDTELKHNNEED